MLKFQKDKNIERETVWKADSEHEHYSVCEKKVQSVNALL